MKKQLISCFLVLLGTGLMAQESSVLPAPAKPVAPSGADEPVTLQMASGTLSELLKYYEATSGKILIRDAQMMDIPNIKVVVPGELPKSQALRLVESILVLNGVTLVPGEDNTVKVLGANKPARSEGIPVYANLSDLPRGDQVVSYFMPMRYISANEAFQIFQNAVPPHPQYGSYVPVPHAQAIILIDNASTIRQVVALKELVDVPPAKIVSKFVVLQRADAERVAEVITKLIENRKNKAQAAAGGQPAVTPESVPGAAVSMNERSLVAGDVELVADARTNRILVITRPVNFDYIKGLIEEFDNAVTLTAPLERPLKYVMASDVLPVLETLLMENQDGQSGAGQAAKTPANQQNQQRTNSNNSSGNSSRTNTERTLNENQDTAPEALMVGKTRLIADKQANSIIVIGPPESVDKVSSILDRLDKRPLQVYLSTVIGQLSIGKDSLFAVDLLQKFSNSGDFGVASSIRNRSSPGGGSIFTPDPKVLTSASAFANAASGLTIYGAIGSALDYYVQALESTSRFKVVSRPVIYTQNNKGAVISSGQRIAVPSSTLTSLDTGTNNSAAVTSNIDYTDVELKLEVVPLINSDREVTLKIKQTNDSIVGSQVISGNSIPTIGTQFIDTTIAVPNRGTVVLGGLVSEDSTNTVTGVPILKDIPVLGYLFKGTTKDKNRSELIIMIQPVVVGSEVESDMASIDEERRVEIGQDARNFSEQSVMLSDSLKKKQKSKPAPNSNYRGLTKPLDKESAPAPVLETP
jgi:general secretion pathway protein D